MSSPPDEDFQALKALLITRFRIPESKVTMTASFRGTFGFDSIETVEFIDTLEAEFGLARTLDNLTDVHTVEDVLRVIATLRRAP